MVRAALRLELLAFLLVGIVGGACGDFVWDVKKEAEKQGKKLGYVESLFIPGSKEMQPIEALTNLKVRSGV